MTMGYVSVFSEYTPIIDGNYPEIPLSRQLKGEFDHPVFQDGQRRGIGVFGILMTYISEFSEFPMEILGKLGRFLSISCIRVCFHGFNTQDGW